MKTYVQDKGCSDIFWNSRGTFWKGLEMFSQYEWFSSVKYAMLGVDV